jgi:glycosyltransferase involved in cell wall biosynthesis
MPDRARTWSRFIGLALSMPALALALTAAVGLRLADASVALVVLTLVWALFLAQLFSGRLGWAFVRYARLRFVLLNGRAARSAGARRTIAHPHRNAGAPRLAWSYDGWAHADGALVGLDRLDQLYEVIAFGCEQRTSGDPPVTLELLPTVPYYGGILLEGLTDRLAPFDAVWAYDSHAGTTLQALDARAAGGPAIVCFDVENLLANYGHTKHPIRQRAVREVDHFCAGSEAARALLELDGVDPDRISMAPFAVDMPSYSEPERAALRIEGRRRWGFADEDLVALFIGRAVWEKGLHTIAAAAATLAHRGNRPEVRWLVAGEGDYLPTFREVTRGYGVEHSTVLAGAVAGRDRHLAYATADLLVVPSIPVPHWVEQFGRVIPEALHFGLPVIGSASGAIPEVVGEAGVIVAPADHVALADAVSALADRPRRSRLSELARQRAATEFSVDRYIEVVSDAVDRAIAHRSKQPAHG